MKLRDLKEKLATLDDDAIVADGYRDPIEGIEITDKDGRRYVCLVGNGDTYEKALDRDTEEGIEDAVATIKRRLSEELSVAITAVLEEP